MLNGIFNNTVYCIIYYGMNTHIILKKYKKFYINLIQLI